MAASLTRVSMRSMPRISILTKCVNYHGMLPKELVRHPLRFFRTSVVHNVAGIPIKMPSLSPTMTEGTILKWLKQEGETVQPGDVVCDIQTDKTVVSLEVEEEGILAKIMMPENSKPITVGHLIALMVDPGEDWTSVEVPPDDAASGGITTEAPPQLKTEAPFQSSDGRLAVSIPTTAGPAVRALLELYGVDWTLVTATGPHGKLVKGDVLGYVIANRLTPLAPQTVPTPALAGLRTAPAAAQPSTAAAQSPAAAAALPAAEAARPVLAADQDYIDIPLSGMRKTIAKRLTQSKTEIPHAYIQSEAPVDRLLAVRKQLKAEGVKTSLNDYIIKAVSLCLRLHPEVNCVWNGDQLERAADVDISVAVATDAGLITPIVRSASDLSVADINSAVQDLAGRARDGKLKPHEFIGGTFTISNLGMFGVDEFTAIINPPQCGILAVGGGGPIVAEDGSVETWMTSTLSYDARAIPQRTAAAFMETLAALLAGPDLLLTDARRRTADRL